MTFRLALIAGSILTALGACAASVILGQEPGVRLSQRHGPLGARTAAVRETPLPPVSLASPAATWLAESREGEPVRVLPAASSSAPEDADRRSALAPSAGPALEPEADLASAPDPGADLDPEPDERERARELLLLLSKEEDPLAAVLLGEELALRLDLLGDEDRARLVELAREGGASRLAALRACGRLAPVAASVREVQSAALVRTSPEVRAAAVDALLLLRARGAPPARVAEAVRELTHPAWGPLDRQLALARASCE